MVLVEVQPQPGHQITRGLQIQNQLPLLHRRKNVETQRFSNTYCEKVTLELIKTK